VVYAEHFLEHLPLDQAIAFLREAHRVLRPGGWLRLSTPNLEWVLGVAAAGDAIARGLHLNTSFHGWSHRFLWNRELLAEALLACGFTDLRWHRHGESERQLLRGLERHETYGDTPELPHVLVVEASRGEPQPARLAAMRQLLEERFLRFARPLGHRIDFARSSLVARMGTSGPLGRLVREHVLRGWLVGGALRRLPEAPEESELIVDVDLRHVVLDDPEQRRGLGLPPLPGALRRAARARLTGEQGLAVERFPVVRFQARGLCGLGKGRVRRAGTLELRGVRRELVVESVESVQGDEWRAQVNLLLPLVELGVPPWRLAGGLLRGCPVVALELRLVGVPVTPT
jgi:hypothetical protein